MTTVVVRVLAATRARPTSSPHLRSCGSAAHSRADTSSHGARKSWAESAGPRDSPARRAERARVVTKSPLRPADVTGLRPAMGVPMFTGARPVDPSSNGRWLPAPCRSNAADHLMTLVTYHRELLGEIQAEVRRLRNQGSSWTVVGDAIGLRGKAHASATGISYWTNRRQHPTRAALRAPCELTVHPIRGSLFAPRSAHPAHPEPQRCRGHLQWEEGAGDRGPLRRRSRGRSAPG